MGETGRPTSRPNSATASSPPCRAATAARVVEPASIAARRTASRGTPEATATASCTSASSAPCRTSPVTRPRSQACSGPVARPNRSATAAARAARDPLPSSAATASKPSCTSATVSVGESAGSGSSARERQPRPGAALAQGAAEVRRQRLDLVRLGPREQRGERRHLGLAGPGGGHLRGGVDEVGEQHAAIQQGRTDRRRRRRRRGR